MVSIFFLIRSAIVDLLDRLQPTSGNMTDTNSPQEVLLFVKAGDDGKSYGACPFCQRIFMILFIKSKVLNLKFRVATVNFAKPPDIFKQLILRRVPALVHGETALDDVDEIIQYLDETFPSSSLDCDDPEADKCCLDIFQKFCFFIKDVSKDSSQLEHELVKIDQLLTARKLRFLCSDNLTHLDCELLPKLHHVRVACKSLKDFELPLSLTYLWSYLGRAYSDEVFKTTCPSDQAIIMHWAEKPETPNLTMEEKARLAREQPKFSTSVPVCS